MQFINEADYNKRTLYCWAKLYINQLKECGNYTDLKKSHRNTYIKFHINYRYIEISLKIQNKK
jgi:hypothetical protein